MSLSKEIGIDLGTANILIYAKGEGIVVNEPSVVTINVETNRPVAVGEEAREMLGKTPGKLKAIRPLKDGVIADFQTTEILLTHFINKLNLKGIFARPTILICCPSNITSIEKSAIQDVALRCGAKKVYIEEEPKVAAIGAGLDISKPSPKGPRSELKPSISVNTEKRINIPAEPIASTSSRRSSCP